MERKIIKTGDGSVTIHLPEWDEQYHSKHGAVQEALHVFLKTGLDFYLEQQSKSEVSILEIGFGTGLNAFLTALQAEKLQLKVNYTGVEAYPIAAAELKDLNYAEVVSEENKKEVLLKMHETGWEQEFEITPFFSLTKEQKKFQEIEKNDQFDLVYFDAFGARVQPELWTEEIFKIMYRAMKPQGVLVTYAAKGSVRRAMQAVGFLVERLPGPPGKREMLRATKG
ncbi:MAG: tRNA (5-methylaminomethyl-2-thiouridine)(34)-methyltransferase MnmD [Salegentibacter sp.]